MDLEQVRAAWQREEFDGYLFETPPNRIADDVRRKAEAMDQAFAREQTQLIFWSLLTFAVFAFQYDLGTPLLANLGVTLILLGQAQFVVSTYILRSRYRTSQSELDPRQYLIEQKKRVMARISALRRNVFWSLIPVASGFVLMMSGMIRSTYGMTIIVTLMGLAGVAGAGYGHWRIRKEFRPALQSIERELDELDEPSL